MNKNPRSDKNACQNLESINYLENIGNNLEASKQRDVMTHNKLSLNLIREVKIDVYGRPVTANGKLQFAFEGKFYKFSKVSTSF